MKKRTLQVVSAVLGLIPIATGLVGMSGVADPLYGGLPANTLLDSNLRFFAGVWFGLGVALYCLLPNIERQTTLFRALWGMIFAGGIGRLISMLLLAVPPLPFVGFTALELIGAPLMIFWQSRVASAHAALN